MSPRSEFSVTAVLRAVTYGFLNQTLSTQITPFNPIPIQIRPSWSVKNHLLSFQGDLQNTRHRRVGDVGWRRSLSLSCSGPLLEARRYLVCLIRRLSCCKSSLYYIYCQHGAPGAPDPTPKPRWAPPPAVLKKVFNLMPADSKTTTDTSKWSRRCDSSDSELAC